MDAGVKQVQVTNASPWGQLPPRIRVLFITGGDRSGAWLVDAFASDSACIVELESTAAVAQGLSRLRDEAFDAVLIGHHCGRCDAMAAVEAVRTGSGEDLPIIVLGEESEEEMAALCFEAGGDAYICIHTTTTRTLLWNIARARERHHLISENRKLRHAQRHQLQLEHNEAARLLRQQREMLSELEQLYSSEGSSPESNNDVLDLPAVLVEHYRELLRSYVIMGSGNLGEEMNQLAELLTSAAVAPQQAMRLHLMVLEEMIKGLGSRSARHVMNRADMLILEVMMNLGATYRERYLRRSAPPQQLWLPL